MSVSVAIQFQFWENLVMKKFALLIACAMLCTSLFASCGTKPLGGLNNPMDDTDDDTKEAVYVPGTTSEDGYVSEYIGLEFVPQGTMVMATEDELYEAMGLGAELVGMDKKTYDWATVGNAYEMMATDITTGSNVIVMAEKLALKNITMDQYIEALEKQFESVDEMTVTFDSVKEVTFVGQTYTRIDVTTEVSGMSINQVMLLRKIEDRMIGITVTAVMEGDDELLLSCFKAK